MICIILTGRLYQGLSISQISCKNLSIEEFMAILLTMCRVKCHTTHVYYGFVVPIFVTVIPDTLHGVRNYSGVRKGPADASLFDGIR